MWDSCLATLGSFSWTLSEARECNNWFLGPKVQITAFRDQEPGHRTFICSGGGKEAGWRGLEVARSQQAAETLLLSFDVFASGNGTKRSVLMATLLSLVACLSPEPQMLFPDSC